MKERNVFCVLEYFLREFDHEVRGRGARDTPNEILSRIHTLAAGRSGEKERTSLVEELVKNPEWIGVLAEAVKKRRNA